MKSLIIIVTLALVSCAPPAPSANNSEEKRLGDFTVIVIDECEYITYSRWLGSTSGVYTITHKGNCKYCIQRNKK